jgi:SSS family solute:Na+ symporter
VFLLLLGWLAVGHPALSIAVDAPEVTPDLRERCVAVLRRAMREATGWTKVTAAECLLGLDYPQGVREVLQSELARAGDAPGYRIGIWRVLAEVAHRGEERAAWVKKIRDVFLDSGAADRIDALKSLAEIGYQVPDDEAEPFETVSQLSDPTAAYAVWVLVNSERKEAAWRLVELVGSEDPATYAAAAYVLGRLSDLDPDVRKGMWTPLVRPLGDSRSHVLVIGAAVVHALEPHFDASFRKSLREYAAEGTPRQRSQACRALAAVGRQEDLPVLTPRLDDPEADVGVAAAWAVLRIGRRVPRRLPVLDWWIIGLYLAAMLGVGWYYARRTKTTDDYLLGGRKMKPLAVGMSLFATMLSTISYLAWPGEIIRYGPMMLAGICAYPLVLLLAGWFMIPYIMKLKITSAYEILEVRLGPGFRVLGSALFLAMRLLWMAVIIFATTNLVLVPLLGLDRSATPYVCAVLGVITVTYTTMGGLRAVVLTESRSWAPCWPSSRGGSARRAPTRWPSSGTWPPAT